MTSGVAEKDVVEESASKCAKPPVVRGRVDQGQDLHASASGQLPASAPFDQERPPRGPDGKFHTVWLCMSAGIILLSMVMQVRNSQQVNIPFTDSPLPSAGRIVWAAMP